MSLVLPAGAQTHKDVVSSDQPWYWLYEVEVPTNPPTRYRLVSAMDGWPDDPIEFGFDGSGNALVYYPFPISHSAAKSDTEAGLQDATLAIANISREIQTTIDAYDMIGQEVRILLVHRADLASSTAAAIQTFQITGIEWNQRWVTASIGQYNTLRRSFPARLGLRHHCGFLYRGPRCGYLAAGLPTCDKTLLGATGCIAHGTQEAAEGLPVQHPERFGGFPRDAEAAVTGPTVMTAPTSSTTSGAPARHGSVPIELLADIRGAPYRLYGTDPRTGLDCSSVCYLVLTRCGFDLPPLPAPGCGSALGSAVAAWFARCAELFDDLPYPPPGGPRCCDVLEAVPDPDAPHDLHLSVVVQEAPPAALTATGALGVVRVRVGALRGVRRVLRPRTVNARWTPGGRQVDAGGSEAHS